MAKGEIISPASTQVPNQKGVGGQAYDQTKGGEIVNPASTPTPDSSLQAKRKVSQTAFEGVPSKGEVINPAATIAPVPTKPSLSGNRPSAMPKAWE